MISARGAIWTFVGAGLSLAALADALVHVTQWRHPTIALRLAPHDPTALAVHAGQLMLSAPGGDTPQHFREAETLARKSLAGQPLNPQALRVLGYTSEASGKTSEARSEIAAALSLSRREFLAQLWAIEDRVRNNDVPGALLHYDLAMRSSAGGPDLLIPTLSQALAQPEVRRALAPHIRAAPYWLPALVTYAATREDPRWIAAAIMQAGGLPRGDAYRKYEGQLIETLAQHHYPGAARAFYLSLAGIDRSVPYTVRFSKTAVDSRFAPISWSGISTPNIPAIFLDRNGATALRLQLDPGQSGVVLQKLLFLAPGAYQLTLTPPPEAVAAGAIFSWSAECISEGNSHALPVLVSEQGAQPAGFVFKVPMACRAELVSLTASREAGSGPLDIYLTEPTLRTVREH